MPNQQPCARENLVELLLVNVRVYKDLTADETVVDIDKLKDFKSKPLARTVSGVSRPSLPVLSKARAAI